MPLSRIVPLIRFPLRLLRAAAGDNLRCLGILWAGVVAALLLSWGGASWNESIVRERMREDLLLVAEATAAAIDVQEVAAISELENESLRRLRRHFHAFSRGSGFENIRLSVSFPDGSGFMVGTGEHLPVSQAAADWGSAEVAKTVAAGFGRVVGPYATRNGSFVGAFVPVKDGRSGETLLVVAAEADADHWAATILQERPSPMPFALLIGGLLAVGGMLLERRDRLSQRSASRLRHLEVVLVALLGSAATAAAALAVQDHELRAQEDAFVQLSRERALAIRDAFHEISDLYLGGTAGLFENSEAVSREEFRAYVRPILRSGLVDAMNWAPAVPRALVPAMEARAEADGLSEFRIGPIDGRRELLFPIFYREPLEGNRPALGFELGSEPKRLTVIEEAASTGLPTASEVVELVGAKRPQSGVLCFRPVFAALDGGEGMPYAAPGLLGFAIAVVHLRPLLERTAVSRSGDREAVLAELYQLRSAGEATLLASTAGEGGRPEAGEPARPGTVFPVFFLGKTYGFVLRPGPGFDTSDPRRAGLFTLIGGVLLTAAAGSLAGMVTSRRRRLEQCVQERTVRLASIIRGTRAGTWEWNLETDVLLVDDRWAEIAGLSVAELSPLTMASWRGFCHPDDLDRWQRLLDEHLAGRLGYFDGECRMRHRGGRWVWVQDRGAVVEWGSDGRPRLMTGTRTDITERKRAEEALQRSEEMLRLAVEAASDGLWDWDVDTGVIECNDRGYTLFGYAPHEITFTFEVWKAMVHPDERERVVAEVLRQLRDRGQLAVEYRCRCKDGSWLWVLLRGRVFEKSGGSGLHMAGTATDIDRRRRAEEEAIRARLEAEMASHAKSEFLANTSHELRTPLNSIIGFSSALVSGVFGPIANAKHSEYLTDIESSGRHLLSLINDILDLSAVEAGKLELQEEEFEVAEACAAVVRLVRLRADQHRVTLISNVPSDLPPLVADQRRFKQVLLNLLTNAIKFTPAGGSVKLSARRDADGGLSLVVADNGIGMDEEGMRRAMMEFMRVDSSLSRNHEGAGLGLPLSRRLMEKHGGTLRLASTPGAGTVATATFPAARVIARTRQPA